MLDRIINTCKKLETAYHNVYGNHTYKYDEFPHEDNEFLTNFNIEFAKAILNDIDEDNARKIAKIILSAIE